MMLKEDCERIGVLECGVAFQKIGFMFREQPIGDYGIDAIIETRDEMGSGANWVSCHIALFLSFLHYFAKQENSPMPLFMFFDQPSQVYFPQGNINDSEVTQSDITAVNKMYKTIFDEIKEIEKDTGILPQIIIVDHVDGDNLEVKKEFAGYVRCNWRNEEKLI